MGILLLIISGWALLLPPRFPYTAQSIVNCRVVTLKAEQAGEISGLPGERRRQVRAGETVAVVQRDLRALQRRVEERQLARDKLQAQLAELDRMVRAGETRAAETRQAERSLWAQKEEATKEKMRILSESVAEARAAEKRIEPLFKDGIVTAAQLAVARTQTIDAEQNLITAQNELLQVRQTLNGLAAGGEGDAVNGDSSRQLEGWRVQRSELTARLEEADLLLSRATEDLHADRTDQVKSPVAGFVWRSLVVNGEHIEEGQAVIQIAAADAPFVDAYFSRHFLGLIEPGQPALVWMMSNRRKVEGRVVNVELSGRDPVGANPFGAVDPEAAMVHVTVEMPTGRLAPTEVGSGVKVLVTPKAPSWWDQLQIKLNFFLREG